MNNRSLRRIPLHSFVRKEILSAKKIHSDRPREGAVCKLCLSNLYLEDKSVLLHSEYFKPGVDVHDLHVIIGEADCALDRGLETALCRMGAGEEAKITHNLNGQEITVDVKLIEFENPTFVFEWPDEKKFSVASIHKEKGNKLFIEKRYEDAFHRFSKAVKLVVIGNDDGADGKSDLFLTLCNNMAACQLYFHNYDFVVDLCKKVLSRAPNNLKSLARRMDARVGLRDYENARVDATKILQLSPSDEYAKKKLDFINKKLADQHVRYVKMVKQMFIS